MRWLFVVALIACKPRKSEPDVPPVPQYTWNEAVELAKGEPAPTAIAVDATHIYWNNFGKSIVRKMPLAGGKISTVYEGNPEIGGRGIALDADGIYFDEAFNIKRVPKTGGAAVDLGVMPYMPNHFVADKDGAYSEASSVITRHPGGTLANESETWDIAVDATHIYWLARDGVKRVPKAGGKIEVLAKGLFRFGRMTITDTDVYWGDAVLESVFAVPKAGGPARFIAKAWSIAGKGIEVDHGNIYVMASGGTLEKLDEATHSITSIATSLTRGGSADTWIDFTIVGNDALCATGGSSLIGVGPVVIDLTKPGAKMPEYRYDGAILRVPLKLGAKPYVQVADELQVGFVWFTGAEMQEPARATQWIEDMDEFVGKPLADGTLRVHVNAKAEPGDAGLADKRVQVVADAIRAKVPTAKVITGVDTHEGQDVRILLEVSDVLALMHP